MRRTKASGSVEVKKVIGALCKVLAAVGVDSVPVPESFRRAKFGGGAEEDQFWQLLSSILQKSAVVSSEVGLQQRGASEQRAFVAAGLRRSGYRADWMSGRPAGDAEGGRSFSSRDLLLALGWLLAAGTLEELLTRRVQQLDKTLLTPVPVNLHLSGELQLDSASLGRLQWLVGRLRHQGRILMSMIQEQTRLLHAVFSASLSSDASSSCGQSSAGLKEDLVCVQQLCDVLESYLSWRRVEDVFWTWMDSVVDHHLTGSAIRRTTHEPSGSPGVCHHGNKPDHKLLGLPADTHTHTPTQEGPRRSRREVKDRGGGEQGGAGPPFPSSLPSLPFMNQAYRAKLQTGQPVRQQRSEKLHSSTEAPQLKASQVVQMLLRAEALLLERRDQQRRTNRTQLQEMIGSRDELVLIPP